VKTFLLLAGGRIHTLPDHPATNTIIMLMCRGDGFGLMLAVTDVCPKKALTLLTVKYVVFTHQQCHRTHADLPN